MSLDAGLQGIRYSCMHVYVYRKESHFVCKHVNHMHILISFDGSRCCMIVNCMQIICGSTYQ